MRVAFHFYGPAGDHVTAVTMGEASDVADKASNKAMSAALKYALIHTFMIPVDAKSLDDGDRDHPEGQHSPADAYAQRLRKPAVWNNVNALTAMHAEVKADGLLGETVYGPDGATTLETLIVGRGKQLRAEAAEREARKAQEAGEVAAQIAAETGAAHGDQAAADGVDHLARLREQANSCWKDPGNSLALAQIILDAEKHGVADSEVPLRGGGTATFRQLLNNRIIELDNLAAQGGDTEKSAA
jgi:hypothetical protein